MLKQISIFVIFVTSNIIFTQPIVAAELNLQAQILQLVNNYLPNTHIGIVVQDADSGITLYEQHAKQHFAPASTAKLLVAAAALTKLTQDYRFTTTVKYAERTVKAGVLHGALAFEFKGDPTFSSDRLSRLLHALKRKNIKAIYGDIVIDDHSFSGPAIAPGVVLEDASWHYAAPTTALVLDENKIFMNLIPEQQLGGKTTVKLLGINSKFVKLANSKVKTVSKQDSEDLCQLELQMDNNNSLSVAGCWPISATQLQYKIAVHNVRKLMQDKLIDLLAEASIKFTGKIKFGLAPANLAILAVDTSEPISSMLPKVLAESNNFYSDLLLKTLGYELHHIGSFKTGTLAVKQILQELTGIELNTLRLVDGAGNSTYDLVTPRQLAQLLQVIYRTEALKTQLINALAISGRRGTLQDRLTTRSTIGKIKAKTGGRQGVSGLAGYLTTHSNKTLIITFLTNNSLAKAKELKKMEDELCVLLATI